jgi:hypothetical protein
LVFIAIGAFFTYYIFILSGCAQISAPTGGLKDTLAPRLVKGKPALHEINFHDNKLSFTFDEYVDLKNLSTNLVVSPFQRNNPVVSANLKTITLKFKDSLLPNTTYTIDFGNAIADINEGNVLKNFSVTFSTGSAIDNKEIKGKVLVAETGKVDSTLLVLLYKNAPDSAITTRKPDYIAKLNGKGEFIFKNLPAASFSIYALKDGDGNKFYNSKSELFAFQKTNINTQENNSAVLMYAFAEQTPSMPVSQSVKKEKDNNLKYSSNLTGGKLDLLQPLTLKFNRPLLAINEEAFLLFDKSKDTTKLTTISGYNVILDQDQKTILINNIWIPNNRYVLMLDVNKIKDTSGMALPKSDTIVFTSKKKEEYASLRLTFSNMNLAKHPILQLVENEKIKFSSPLTTSDWSSNMLYPGDYEIRVFFDDNNNGKWDNGSYLASLQPEITVCFPEKISIKANWDNERNVIFQ